MPIYENNSTIYKTFQNYRFQETEDPLPLEKRDLMTALNQMRVRDSRIQWIGLYSDFRKTNYILYNDNTGIKTLDQISLPEGNFRANQLRCSPRQRMKNAHGVSPTFAIYASKPVGMGKVNTYQYFADLKNMRLT